MKKLFVMAVIAVLVLSFASLAFATEDPQCPPPRPNQDHDIGGDGDVQLEIDLNVGILPTIAIDTYKCGTNQEVGKTDLSIWGLNPKTNPEGSDCLEWLTRSNLPFWKTIAWTKPSTSYTLPNGVKVRDTLATEGENGEKGEFAIEVSEESCTTGFYDPSDPINGWKWNDPIQDRYNSPIKGLLPGLGPCGCPVADPGKHKDTEYVRMRTKIIWCDSAGHYTGKLFLDAHQL